MDPSKADPESLLKSNQPGVCPAPGPPREPLPWVPIIGFVFLTVSCVQAVYRSVDDPWTVSFVVSAYAALLLLFWCLRRLEELPRDGSSGREERRLKLSVWALAMLLNAMFSCRVATMLPPALAVVVWAVASFTTLAGFYMLFVYGERVAPSPPGKA